VNRREFIREIVRKGCVLERHGRKHDLYLNPRTGRKAPVPRHNELKDTLCEGIRKQLGID
jgi:hypothetical protein